MSDLPAPLFCVPSPWTTRIRVTGEDHVRFIQGLCSNDVKELERHRACECFVPTVQGKILAHGFFWKHEEALEFMGLEGQTDALLPHLQKYALIEDVDVVDISNADEGILLWGDGAAPLLQEMFTLDASSEAGSMWTRQVDGVEYTIYSIPNFAAPCWEVRSPDLKFVNGAIKQSGGCAADTPMFEAWRIARRFPRHGVDITADHLGQEADRDQQAISFQKGCYLGQETIARIDAMGHVNKQLVPIRLEGQIEELPHCIELDGKTIGQVTSLAEIDSQQLGLAMLRRGHNTQGTKLTGDFGKIEVL